jgi:plastocyanin
MDNIGNVFRRAIHIQALSILIACLVVPGASLAAEPSDGGPQQITLRLGDFSFDPDTIEVALGHEVELTLISDEKVTPHNFSLFAPPAGIDVNVDIRPGKTVTVRFTPTAAGDYPFHCDKEVPHLKSHRDRGMTGTLVVR